VRASGADLRGAKLSGADLRGSFLAQAQLDEACGDDKIQLPEEPSPSAADWIVLTVIWCGA
jgi:hypothetical protein